MCSARSELLSIKYRIFSIFPLFISVRGARPRDAGRWSCEVGAKLSSRRGRGRWALAGEIIIQIQQERERAGENSETIASVIQANTTLLVICVVVFIVFMTILVGVVFMYGRSKLSQTPPDSSTSSARHQREPILIREEQRIPRDFIRRVLPHIIKFPIRDNQPSNT